MKYVHFFLCLGLVKRLSQIVPIIYHHRQPLSLYILHHCHLIILNPPNQISKRTIFSYSQTKQNYQPFPTLSSGCRSACKKNSRMQHAPNLDYTPLLTMFLRIETLHLGVSTIVLRMCTENNALGFSVFLFFFKRSFSLFEDCE